MRVAMVTGDQPATPRNLAQAVGPVDKPNVEVVQGGDVGELEKLSGEEEEHTRARRS